MKLRGREVDVSDERDAPVLQGVGRDEVRGAMGLRLGKAEGMRRFC